MNTLGSDSDRSVWWLRLTGLLAAVLFTAGLAVAAPVAGPADSGGPAAEAAVRKHVDPTYTLLRRSPASYVVGTAYKGWTADIQQSPLRGYRWGRIFGTVNMCLWIYSGAVSGSGAADQSCPTTGRSLSTSVFTNGQIGGGASDGANVKLTSACPTWDGRHIYGYGNVLPWLVPTQAHNQQQMKAPIGGTVKWRYVTKDGAYVMIRDSRNGSTDGTGLSPWYFVPRGCLPASLPGQQS